MIKLRKSIMSVLLCMVFLGISACSMQAFGTELNAKNEMNNEPEERAEVEVQLISGGQVISQQTVEAGTEVSLLEPDVSGSRFICWKDSEGTEIYSDTFAPVKDTQLYVYSLPIFGTHEPYLFMNDINLLLPETELTYEDFAAAVKALTPSGSAVPELSESDTPVDAQYIKDTLGRYYTENELSGLFETEGSVTRTQFAVTMNMLLGRTEETVILNDSSLKTVDIKEDTPYRADLLEASVAHEQSDEGRAWSDCSPENSWRDFGDYMEMKYTVPTQEGTVEVDYGPNYLCYLTYLPYGYDPEKQYNVLIYLNGADGDPYKMLGTAYSYSHGNSVFGTGLTTKSYIDFLIQYGYCDPLIVVSTNMSMGEKSVWRYVDLIQHTVENYSTYAEGTETDDLIAARSHFAIAGPSSASQSICIAIKQLPDIFGSYGLFSGIYHFDETYEAFQQKDKIDFLVMNSGGWKDHCEQATLKAYDSFSQMDNILHSSYVYIEKLGHDWETFDAGILELLAKFNPNTRNIHLG